MASKRVIVKPSTSARHRHQHSAAAGRLISSMHQLIRTVCVYSSSSTWSTAAAGQSTYSQSVSRGRQSSVPEKGVLSDSGSTFFIAICFSFMSSAIPAQQQCD